MSLPRKFILDDMYGDAFIVVTLPDTPAARLLVTIHAHIELDGVESFHFWNDNYRDLPGRYILASLIRFHASHEEQYDKDVDDAPSDDDNGLPWFARKHPEMTYFYAESVEDDAVVFFSNIAEYADGLRRFSRVALPDDLVGVLTVR